MERDDNTNTNCRSSSSVKLNCKGSVAHFPLASKQERPAFEYMVMKTGEFDYYVYNSFNDALSKAVQLGAGAAGADVFELDFNTITREWRVCPTFHVSMGKVRYDKHARTGLHVLFHTQAGRWLNAEEWEAQKGGGLETGEEDVLTKS